MIVSVSSPVAARALLCDDRLVVLATETTGRALSAVALLNRHGQVLLHTRIRPAYPGAPPLEVLWPPLAALLTGRIVVGFHAACDRRVLRQTARRLGATVMYNDWCCVGTLTRTRACRERAPTLHAADTALSEARAALAVLRAQATPATQAAPSRHVFWRYLR